MVSRYLVNIRELPHTLSSPQERIACIHLQVQLSCEHFGTNLGSSLKYGSHVFESPISISFHFPLYTSGPKCWLLTPRIHSRSLKMFGTPSKDAAGEQVVAESPPHSPASTDMNLMCTKCEEPTTMRNSQASGSRNPLLRICNECCATDKGMTRKKNAINQKLKKGIPLAPDDVDVRALVNKYTADQKVQFYRDEKAARADVDDKKPRSFSSIKGVVEQSRRDELTRKELDNFETFEDFAVRQITLKRANTEADAWKLFQKELADGTKQKIKVRGVWLLGKFSGVEFGNSSTDMLSCSLKRAQEVESKDDLQKFQEVASDLAARRSRVAPGATSVRPEGQGIDDMDVEGAIIEPDIRIASSSCNGVTKMMKQDLQRKQEEEEFLEAELVRKVLEKKAEKDNKKKAGEDASASGSREEDGPSSAKKSKTSKSIALIEYEALLKKSKSALADLHEDLQNKFAGWLQITETCNTAPEPLPEVDRIKTDFTAAIEEMKSKCQAKGQPLDEEFEKVKKLESGAEVKEASRDLKKNLSEFMSDKSGTLKGACVKCIGEMRDFSRELKQAQDKHDKEAAKLAAKQSRVIHPPAASIHEHQLVKQLADKGAIDSCNLSWSLDKDFWEAQGACTVAPEMLKDALEKIVAMPYYESQKAWVANAMKGKLNSSAAAIVKKGARITVEIAMCKSLDKSLLPTQGSHSAATWNWLAEVLDYQFFQVAANSGDVANSPYFLSQCRFYLQGKTLVAGVPFEKVAGAGIDEKIHSVRAMDSTAFIELAKTDGFVATLTAGKIILIPGRMIFVEIALGEVLHGLRWSLIGSKAMQKTSLRMIKNMITERIEFKVPPYTSLADLLEASD